MDCGNFPVLPPYDSSSIDSEWSPSQCAREDHRNPAQQDFSTGGQYASSQHVHANSHWDHYSTATLICHCLCITFSSFETFHIVFESPTAYIACRDPTSSKGSDRQKDDISVLLAMSLVVWWMVMNMGCMGLKERKWSSHLQFLKTSLLHMPPWFVTTVLSRKIHIAVAWFWVVISFLTPVTQQFQPSISLIPRFYSTVLSALWVPSIDIINFYSLLTIILNTWRSINLIYLKTS